MDNPFRQVPKTASLDDICGEAGKVFAARKESNPLVDFNTEVWFLAGDAVEAGLLALSGMARGQVAQAMGDSISRWIDSKKTAFKSGINVFEEGSGTPGSEYRPARWFTLRIRMDESGDIFIREYEDTNGHHINNAMGHTIGISGAHLPSLAALVAKRCGRAPTADYQDSLVTCLMTLVDLGKLGPQLGFGGNERVIRSWLNEGHIPHRRWKLEWMEGMSMPEEWEVPNPNP